MDYTTIVFVIAAVLSLVSAILLFAFRDILHAVLALTMVFMFNSLLFLVLQQPILAIIQLFVMVGGISTFLFVGVASAELVSFKFTKLIGLTAVWLIVFIALIYPLVSRNYLIPETESNVFGVPNIVASLGQYSMLYYIMIAVLFSVSLGAIIALKRIGASK